jgi:hypothetical protein
MPAGEVDLISNPRVDHSVYQWAAKGLRSLNRKNKLSSLPFWFPNDRMRLHQFRLVLLRGVVREAVESEDAVAIYLEYMAPTKEELAAVRADPTRQKWATPGGCRVHFRLLNQRYLNCDDPTHDVVQEETTVFNEDERQHGVREFILPRVLHSNSFVSEEGGCGIIQVSITTGVNVMAESASEAAASLWSAFSSWGSTVTSAVKKLVVEGRREYEAIVNGRTAVGGSDEANEAHEGKSSVRELPWDAAPPRWAGREEQWRHLTRDAIAEDESTFLIGASRGLSSDDQVLLAQYGLNHRTVMSAESIFDYDRDVHEGLLSSEKVRRQRFRLVPGRVSDVVFWGNYFWKVSVLGMCENDDQVKVLLSIVNAPVVLKPGASSAATFPSAAAPTVAEAQQLMKEVLVATELLQEYLDEESHPAAGEVESSPAGEGVPLMMRTAAASLASQIEKLVALERRLVAASGAGDDEGPASPFAEALRAAQSGAELQLQRFERHAAGQQLMGSTPNDGAHVDGQDGQGDATGASASPAVAAPVEKGGEFGEFPSIEDAGTPSAEPPQGGANNLRKSVSQTSVRSSDSSRRLDFAPMPWEEEE